MKALPFPCIRPSDARIGEALSHMGEILANGAGITGGLDKELLLKDTGGAYYLYEHRDGSNARTALLTICPIAAVEAALKNDGPELHGNRIAGEVTNDVAAPEDLLDLKVQPRPASLAYPDQPVMQMILDAAKEGSPLYELSGAAGVTHRFWAIKRPDAVDAIRAMTEQVPAIHMAGDVAQAQAFVETSNALVTRAKTNGTYTGKEPFNFALCALWPQGAIGDGRAPHVPLGLIMHQIERM